MVTKGEGGVRHSRLGGAEICATVTKGQRGYMSSLLRGSRDMRHCY